MNVLEQVPKVSILMPVKQAENYLSKTIDSIISQSFQEWELIAIDDHSLDESPNILKAYAQKDSRIKRYQNEGHGIIEALRLALKKSSGHLITRMDADDLMSEDKIELMSQKLSDSGPGHLVIGLVKYFKEGTLGDGYKKYAAWLNQLTKKETNYTEIYKECVIPSPNWMCYKSDLEKMGGFKPNVYPEDYDLTFRFYKNDLKIRCVSKVTHHWRDHENRFSRTSDHYKDNRFLDLKISNFLDIDYVPDKSLCILGAGKKAKFITKYLDEKNIPFQWFTNNPNKIGRDIYGVVLQDEKTIKEITNPQILIVVANPSEQANYVEKFGAYGFTKAVDYFLFC